MKNMTRGILSLLVACATSVSYGGQPPRGVAGVDVVVKQNPSKRAVTDTRGTFAFDGLAPGSYTLSFRSRAVANPKTIRTSKTDKTDSVIVANSYSIKIDGAKRSVNQSGLSSDRLLAGVDVKVDLGSGAKVRGQVSSGALKKMVWIPKEPGSHIPGHWAEADSKEAQRSNTQLLSREELTETMNRGNANMTDPRPENPTQVQTSPR